MLDLYIVHEVNSLEHTNIIIGIIALRLEIRNTFTVKDCTTNTYKHYVPRWVMWDIFFLAHWCCANKPRLITINLSRAGKLYIDLYGIDNPHLRLLATTPTVMSTGDNCLRILATSGRASHSGILGQEKLALVIRTHHNVELYNGVHQLLYVR